MSRTSRRIIWFIGLFILVLIFSPLWRYVIDDYFQLSGTYRTLATVLAAVITCGTYAIVTRPLLR
jgi:hypothetical protein